MNTIAEIIDLCEERIQDSKMLHSQGRYDWAFYSAGYAVELVLKARIAKILDFENLFSPDFFDKEVAKFYKTHDLVKLAKIGGLYNIIEEQILIDKQLYKAWYDVRVWNENSRYITKGTINDNLCLNFLQQVEFITLWLKRHI